MCGSSCTNCVLPSLSCTKYCGLVPEFVYVTILLHLVVCFSVCLVPKYSFVYIDYCSIESCIQSFCGMFKHVVAALLLRSGTRVRFLNFPILYTFLYTEILFYLCWYLLTQFMSQYLYCTVQVFYSMRCLELDFTVSIFPPRSSCDCSDTVLAPKCNDLQEP